MLYDCIVVGAGLTGLTLAYKLKKNGLSVAIIEKNVETGGVITSRDVGDYVIEDGPHSAILKPALQELVCELKLEKRLVHPGPDAKKRYFALSRRSGGRRLVPAPTSLKEFLNSNLLTRNAKFRLIAETCLGRIGKEDCSVEEFTRYHFGEELADRVMSAAMSGIYAADINQLSARSALPKLWARDHSSVILSALLKRPEAHGKLASFKFGMSELTDRLAEQFNHEELFLNHSLNDLFLDQDSVTLGFTNNESGIGRALRAKAVAICTPAEVTSKLLTEISPELSDKIGSIPYAPLGILQLSSDSILHPLDGFGFLANPREGEALLGAIFTSTLFPGRAPNGKKLLSCFVGGAVNPLLADVREQSIEEQVINEISELLEISERPQVIAKKYWERAIPNYPIGHYKLARELEDFSFAHPRIKLLGNWISGVSINDRVEAGDKVSKELITDLERSATYSESFSHRPEMKP